MKYLVAPEFIKKLANLGPVTITHVAGVIKKIESAKEESILSSLSAYPLSDSKDEIFITEVSDARIFFTFGNDNEGKYLLLLDILEYDPKTIATWLTGKQDIIKNPIYDSNLNPTFNSNINPIWNQQLNPIWNQQINPIWNQQINPIWNQQINPIWNQQINPMWNQQINPVWNHQLNPIFNSDINPRINSNYKGPYIYNLNLHKEGLLVKASDDVVLLFDNNLKKNGIGVKNPIDGYTLFDNGNKWVGQLVQDNQGGYLRYTDKNKWVGIVV